MNALPTPYRSAAGGLSTEIEGAQRRIAPERYSSRSTASRDPARSARIYRRYEELKHDQGLMDFEDLLERAIETFEDDHAVAEFRDRYAAFTVDEYQDVNLLQQTLERWLGPRDDLCVVGDDYQSIYGFWRAAFIPARVRNRRR
jgi:DNA helicase-2/ATP-dependent DNA helicase PcrA